MMKGKRYTTEDKIRILRVADRGENTKQEADAILMLAPGAFIRAGECSVRIAAAAEW